MKLFSLVMQKIKMELLIPVLILVWIGGYFWFKNNTASEPISFSKISSIKESFQKSNLPIFELALEAYLSPSDEAELLDSELFLPQTTKFPYREIKALLQYHEDCALEVTRPFRIQAKSPLKKAWTFHEAICEEKELPDSFFEMKPLIHPLGASYAYLAFRAGKKSPVKKMRLNERAKDEKVLSEIDRKNSKVFLDRAALILTPNFVLIKKEKGENQEKYFVYPFQAYKQTFSRQAIQVSELLEKQSCFYREGNACWNEDLSRSRNSLKIVIAGLVLLLTFFTFFWMRKRKKMEAQKTFALQALAHEIRTPVTTLVLQMDQMKDSFDQMSPAAQESFLQISDQVQRLARLAENSKSYLKNESAASRKRAQSSFEIQPFIQEIIEDYPDVKLSISGEGPFLVSADAYSLALVVRNLIQNAKRHGKPPIHIDLFTKRNEVYIEVRDAGLAPKMKLREMTAPYQKGDKSEGLGLGLTLVQEVVNSINGKLLFFKNPTRFTVVFKQGKDLNQK